jgi:hypothetical protein
MQSGEAAKLSSLQNVPALARPTVLDIPAGDGAHTAVLVGAASLCYPEDVTRGMIADWPRTQSAVLCAPSCATLTRSVPVDRTHQSEVSTWVAAIRGGTVRRFLSVVGKVPYWRREAMMTVKKSRIYSVGAVACDVGLLLIGLGFFVQILNNFFYRQPFDRLFYLGFAFILTFALCRTLRVMQLKEAR